MTPADMKAARQSCGLRLAEWALALGYQSPDRERLRSQAWSLENGRKPITPIVARLAEMFRRHGVPKEWLSE